MASETIHIDADVDIPQKMIPFMQPMRYKVAYGGRGSGKSWTVARLLIVKALEKSTRILAYSAPERCKTPFKNLSTTC